MAKTIVQKFKLTETEDLLLSPPDPSMTIKEKIITSTYNATFIVIIWTDETIIKR